MMPYDNWFTGKNARFRLYLGLFIAAVCGALYIIDWVLGWFYD